MLKKAMRKILFGVGFCFSITTHTLAQDVGLSFSYFIPRHGEFSTPISPFSIRGLGINLNQFIALQTGASLYRMAGMSIIDTPLEPVNPFLGPNFTIFVPAELVIQLKGKQVQLDLKAGGFFFYGFDQRLNYGNIDRALKKYNSWDFANADLTYENNPGFGYHFGTELTVPVTGQVSVSLETNYLMGAARFPLKGIYQGGNLNGTTETIAVDYNDAKVDFTGLEFSIGLIFSNGGGAKPTRPKRRR
jgi:hypothetical protein